MKLRGTAGWLAATALSTLLTACAPKSCTNVVIGDSIALDEEHRAVVFVRNCGSDPSTTNVSLTPGTGRLPTDEGNIFVADGDRGMVKPGAKGQLAVKAEWMSSHFLHIEFPRDARILLSTPKFENVEIKLVPMSSR